MPMTWRLQRKSKIPLSFNAAPTFLGVQYDRQLTFSEHAKKICQAMTKRTNILRALGGTTWGWRPAELRTIYIATQKFLAEYGSQAWAPWLSKSNLGKLESAQLNAARAITGHLRSTPGEFVLKEAHLSTPNRRSEAPTPLGPPTPSPHLHDTSEQVDASNRPTRKGPTNHRGSRS